MFSGFCQHYWGGMMKIWDFSRKSFAIYLNGFVSSSDIVTLLFWYFGVSFRFLFRNLLPLLSSFSFPNLKDKVSIKRNELFRKQNKIIDCLISWFVFRKYMICSISVSQLIFSPGGFRRPAFLANFSSSLLGSSSPWRLAFVALYLHQSGNKESQCSRTK